jgi:hypothetical protein
MSTEIDLIRAQVQQVLERASADPDYLERLQTEPETTLVEAGVPAEATADLIAELGEDDVAGYIRCDRYTCFFSISACGCWCIPATN